MTKLYKYTSTYGGGLSVTYYRPIDGADQAALTRSDELNIEIADDLAAYNAACSAGEAGSVLTTVEEVDG